MYKLKNIEPENVFHYFEEICKIPHGSSDTEKICKYIISFAKNHNLEYYSDKNNNVIIWKNAAPGHENDPVTMLQGHLDMVCEKESDIDFDFENDELNLISDGDFITAKGTTLGGDDGIAVAFMLAILDDESLIHPPLECVFTSDEEIGMTGASKLDKSMLKAKYLLNIDSEDEGVVLSGCAGGMTAVAHIPLKTDIKKMEEKVFRLKISGLKGGHSGIEIDKGRANACVLLGRLLYALSEMCDIRIINICGGLKDNAIPVTAYADILFDLSKYSLDNIKDEVNKYICIFDNEYKITDSDIRIDLHSITDCDDSFYDLSSSKKIITALVNLPNGIQKMNPEIANLVQTSLNMGIVKIENKELLCSFSVRSSLESEKNELYKRIKSLSESLGGYSTKSGEYPAWEYKSTSSLRNIFCEVFKEQYGKLPEIEVIHAGVECGLFVNEIENLDAVSFGPDIYDIHTTNERMSISSVKRTWNLLLGILRKICNI